MKCWWPSGMCSWINILALKQHSFQTNPILTISPTSTMKYSRNQMEIIVTDLVMRTALSWWAIPFSGILFPSPWWERMDFCHLQKLSSDLSAWWFISKLACNIKNQCNKIWTTASWQVTIRQRMLWRVKCIYFIKYIVYYLAGTMWIVALITSS